MNFFSENQDITHPRIMQALVEANSGFAPSYGNDAYAQKVSVLFKEMFADSEIVAFFCFNGTGANNFALSSISDKCNSILCSDVSHLYTAESTAPEAFTGCRLYPVNSVNGKIEPKELLRILKRGNDVHFPAPTALTITQPTEYGTLYSLEELRTISSCCKEHNILLHIDGARICNALVAMNCTFKEFIETSGADALTLGGTKLGLMFGEAVVFFKSRRFKNLQYNHKRSMQLASKNRFIAAQFWELFHNELWKELAIYANDLAQYFLQKIAQIDPSVIAYPVETNVVFVKMQPALFDKLKPVANFFLWDIEKGEARFVFSFSNTKEEIDLFVSNYRRVVANLAID